jgi:hypothetical protein
MTPEPTNQGQQHPAGQRPQATSAAKGKQPSDDPEAIVKKNLAEAVKSNQTMVEEVEEGDEDAPEPLEVTEYPEGDPDLGAIDPNNPTRPIAMRHRRAYLVRQAERNEAANDQLNAMQTEQNRRIQELPGLLQDPDYMRETSMTTAMTALRDHDPDVVREKHAELAKREKAKADKDDKKNGTK